MLIFFAKSNSRAIFKMEVINDILKIRHRIGINDGISDATNEFKRALFIGDLQYEKKIAERTLRGKYPNKKGAEITEILNEIYPELNS
jgi:hypothetical protein